MPAMGTAKCHATDGGTWQRSQIPPSYMGLGCSVRGICLEEGDGRTAWVDEDAEPADVGDLRWLPVDLCAEGFGFLGRLVDVLYADVGQPEGRHAGHGEDAAPGTFRRLERAVDHVVAHIVVGECPAEHAGVELLGLRCIGCAELKVNERIRHSGKPSLSGDEK